MISRRWIGMIGSPDLSVRIGQMVLKNPVMPASGTFGDGPELAEYLDLDRLGAIVVKTVTLNPRMGAYPHRSTEAPSGSLARIGYQNVGIKRFLEEKLPYFEALEAPLIIGIGGQTIEECRELAEILTRQKRVDALELNTSFPNAKKEGVPFGVDPEGLQELVTQVRETTQKTLIVKLNAMVPDIRIFAEICQKCQADGLSLINGLPGMAIDIRTRRSKLGRNVTGGLTGPAVRPFALYMVWQVCKAVRIPVIGIGGISSTEDAIEFLIAGASAVQIGTMNFVNPKIMAQVIDGIKGYLVQNKMETVSELIGSLS